MAAAALVPPEAPGTDYKAIEDGDYGHFLHHCIKPGYGHSYKVRRMTFALPFDTLARSGFLEYLGIDHWNLWPGMTVQCAFILTVC